MCGIAGIINKKNTKINIKELTSIQNALKHRGPDGEGKYVDKNIGLSMRRLSIIDVKGGDQPLYNEDKSIVIVGNGEIYNYKEIQSELLKKGHKPRTGSDIETAIHAYEEWGVKAFEKFRGMFALALYDKSKSFVYLIRDRMGEKPLFYTNVDGGIYFSSEIKSLMKIENIDKTVDKEAINTFFSFYFIPEPDTPFLSIKKLSPGSYMQINLDNNSNKIVKYWDPKKIPTNKSGSPINKLLKVFSETCDLTLRSDVPVGISLSGGIDSGSILAFCAPKYKGNLKAFCIGYEGTPPSDERLMARELARKYKVEYFETEIKTNDVVKNFPKLIFDCDEPIADIAAHSIYEVSKLARSKNVKVLLNGAGGDELFWGYPSTIDAVKSNINKSFFDKLLNKKGFVYNNPNPTNTEGLIYPLYTNDFKNVSKRNKYKKLFRSYKIKNGNQTARDVFNSVRDFWLKSDVVSLGDRMSMASSVELRAPYLDYKLIETVLASKEIVFGYKEGQKYWQKKLFKGILSEEILNRPKQGFTPPVGDWIAGILKKYSHLLENGFLVKEKIIDKTKINLVSKIITTIPTYSAYQLLVMEIWGRTFVYNENIK